jgi:hypothetical protein
VHSLRLAESQIRRKLMLALLGSFGPVIDGSFCELR